MLTVFYSKFLLHLIKITEIKIERQPMRVCTRIVFSVEVRIIFFAISFVQWASVKTEPYAAASLAQIRAVMYK